MELNYTKNGHNMFAVPSVQQLHVRKWGKPGSYAQLLAYEIRTASAIPMSDVMKISIASTMSSRSVGSSSTSCTSTNKLACPC